MLYPDTEIEPTQYSIIISWEVAEILWQHLFDHELQVLVPREASTNFQKKNRSTMYKGILIVQRVLSEGLEKRFCSKLL